MKISQIAETAQASLLNPFRTSSVASEGVLCCRAFTAQKIAKQHNEAEIHVDSRSKNMIFMNLALGMRPCDRTEIRAERYPIVEVMFDIAVLWYLFEFVLSVFAVTSQKVTSRCGVLMVDS